MILRGIEIHQFLSFSSFIWRDLDAGLNVIVGPNGSGKTNLARAIQAVSDVLLRPQQAASRWTGAGYQGGAAQECSIALEVEWESSVEQHLIGAFFAALLCDPQALQNSKAGGVLAPSLPGLQAYDAWVSSRLLQDPSRLAWFYRGRLVLTYSGQDGWQCCYRSLPDASLSFSLNLSQGSFLCGQAPPGGVTGNSLFTCWVSQLAAEEQERLFAVLGGAQAPAADPPLPEPDLSTAPTWLPQNPGVPLLLGQPAAGIHLTDLSTYRALEAALPLLKASHQHCSAHLLFQQLVERAFLFLDETRRPAGIAPLEASDSQQRPALTTGERLASFLFFKKNGSATERRQYLHIQESFSEITGKRFDLRLVSAPAEASAQGKQEAATTEGTHMPRPAVEIVLEEPWGELPLKWCAAGLAEVLLVTAALIGERGRVLLFDEPARHLHPSLQTSLLQALQKPCQQQQHDTQEGGRCQILLITHAPHLVPTEHLARVSRFAAGPDGTRRWALGPGALAFPEEEHELEQRLRGPGTLAREALFSRAILLVEGETELGVLPLWCPDLALQDILLCSVGGKYNFTPWVRFLRLFGVHWAILADGDFFWNKRERDMLVNRVLQAAGKNELHPTSDPGQSVEAFKRWSDQLAAHGIFTFARQATDGFEEALQAELPSAGQAAARQYPGKVAWGRNLARHFPCPSKWQQRLQEMLRFLSAAGSAADCVTGSR